MKPVDRNLLQNNEGIFVKFWSDRIAFTQPYVYGEQPKDHILIKLNTNENPYGPSEKVKAALVQGSNDSLRLYPEACADKARRQAADFYGISQDCVFVSNGSDETLAFSFLAFLNPLDEVVFPDISYSFYPVYADFFGVWPKIIPLNSDFSMDIPSLCSTKGVLFLANPNAPTGIAIPRKTIEEILTLNPERLVVVDEAYVDFGAETCVSLIGQYENLLVIQTLSKSRSLAGMRLGFAFGNPNLIQGLLRVKDSINSYPVDSLANIAAAAAWQDREHFDRTRNLVMATRERITPALRSLGCQILPSMANFIFLSHPSIPGAAFQKKLREKGILVRHFAKPRIENFLRVSIGTDEEMDQFVATVNQILQNPSV